MCKQVCESEYNEQLQHLEDEISLAIQQQTMDEVSVGGGNSGSNCNTPMRNSSRISVDALTDGESNMGGTSGMMNLSYVDESLEQPRTSLEHVVKKQKKSNNNKKQSMASDIFKFNIGSNKNKNTVFSSAVACSSRNSPRSGSDAEVFVDIESVDERINSMINSSHGFMPIYPTDMDDMDMRHQGLVGADDIIEYDPNQQEYDQMDGN